MIRTKFNMSYFLIFLFLGLPEQTDKTTESTTNKLSLIEPQSKVIEKYGYNRCKMSSGRGPLLIETVCWFFKYHLSNKIIHVWFGDNNRKK